jgi:hypothetical protein
MALAFGRQFMQNGIQMKRGEETHSLGLALQAQFQNAGGGVTRQGDGQHGAPVVSHAAHVTRPHPDRLVTCARGRTHALQVVAKSHTKGKAQRCVVQGTVMTTAMTIQRSPGLLTDHFRLQRALSRQ